MYAYNKILNKALLPKYVADLELFQQVEGSTPNFTSTGRFPLLRLKFKRGFPTGWTLITYASVDTPLPLTPRLYFSRGSTLSHSEATGLSVNKGGQVSELVFVPFDTTEIYVSPICQKGKFTLNNFTIQKAGRWAALGKAIVKEVAETKSVKNVAKKLITGGRMAASQEGRRLLRSIIRGRISNPELVQHARYNKWFAQNYYFSESQITDMSQEATALEYKPTFSIVMPVYNVEEIWLQKAIDSVLEQIYPHWELCIADDASSEPHVKEVLKEYSDNDSRIKVVYREQNGRISEATNSALELATGDYICLMDNDDEIANTALLEFAKRLNSEPSLDMIYSDEDKIAIDGQHFEPFFKPDWSPEYLDQVMYTAHFACYRKALVDKIGGFRSRCNGAQDYDFVLRFTEQTDKIGHIPKILYHWRAIPGSTASSMASKDYVLNAAVNALSDRLERKNIKGHVSVNRYPGCFDIRYELPHKPLVSIVIPSAGKTISLKNEPIDLLANCINKLVERSSYDNYEIIVVDNGDLQESTLLSVKPHVTKFVTYKGTEVNIAAKINLGANEAKGEYLVILNDDIEPIKFDWIEAMLEQALKPNVGSVGAKLIYDDGRLQHVGVTFCEGLPDHVRKKYPRDDPGYFFSTVATRNWMAVTGACMLTPLELFRSVEGFSEEFAINYNDIDFCLKLYARGYRSVYTPHAELYHFESVSRTATVARNEIETFKKKWLHLTKVDPFYNQDYLKTRPPNFVNTF